MRHPPMILPPMILSARLLASTAIMLLAAPPVTAALSTTTARPVGAAQSGVAAPAAQVPGRITSAPASSFNPPPLPAPLPTPTPPPVPSSSAPIGPTLPSIEAAPLPLPTTLSGAPPVQRGGSTSGARAGGQTSADNDGSRLPAPSGRPLSLDASTDPVLQIGRIAGASAPFRDAIAAAVLRNPALGEAEAQADEADAQRREARAGLFPTADVNVTSYDTVSRAFSNDIDNIIERSRPRSRTDAQLSVNQTLLDFGATSTRISAGSARIRAAAAGIDDTAAQIALRTIGAWYDIFTYRSLLAIGQTYYAGQSARRADFAQRVKEGASAQVDVARLDSSLAGLQTRLARYQRSVANAEARFAQLTGRPAPATLLRAPFLGDLPTSEEAARAAAAAAPAVRGATEQAQAARQDARAAGRDLLPNISAGIDAGRYGVIENDRDYDIRARITLRQRLGGSYSARLDQIKARASGSVARSTRIGEEAARDAAIAYADIEALNQQTAALEQSYLAARQSRDTTEERFRVSRGTLFDVIDANDAYFGSAAAYIESLADRDAAHYVLLARTGRLLGALGIDSAYDRARQ